MAEQTMTEEIKSSPETFDLGAFITGKTAYPTREAVVVLDREKVFEARELAEEIADVDEEKRQAQLTDLAPAPEFDEKLEALRAQLERVLEEAEASSLKFTLRGVAPKVWRVADKALRLKHKAQKNASEDEKLEIDIAFRAAINVEIVYSCTVKVTDPNGSETKPTREQIVALSDNLDEHEWAKLVELSNQLTFEVDNLDDAIGSDANFLSKS